MNTTRRQGLGQRYFAITKDYSPTHKDIGDNLRAYLTTVAYAIPIKYLWSIKHLDPFSPYVFRAIAALWAAFVLWYFVLTVVQTFYVTVGLMVHLLDYLFEDLMGDYLKSLTQKHDSPPKILTTLMYAAAYLAAFISGTFVLTTIYIVTALLQLAHF
jgi:hypothetical protein